MDRSIRTFLSQHLPPEGVTASFEVMGLDTQLIEDATYFAIDDGERLIGCGGWSSRATLFGGDHTSGRDSAKLNPATDAARVRAMYTDPDYARRGVGRAILDACEGAARDTGFGRVELMATLSGEPLYRSCGYRAIEHTSATTSNGFAVPLIRMGKPL